jgi:osmotically-inducible protein OsmY
MSKFFGIIRQILQFFSSYATPFERKVGRFFKGIRSSHESGQVKEKLLNLMQENLVVVNLWMEKKYKGYKYLRKRRRKRLYENVEKMVKVFEEEVGENKISTEQIKKLLEQKGLNFPQGDDEKIGHLFEIMQFLRPGKYYQYIKSASFSKLLRDPKKEVLEGDCNQIVTLYAYLFSLKFPLEELKIKLLPEHVCLHFRGIDIEATNATFQKYTEEENQILPITEIISTNLLDISDFREKVRVINPRDIVKSAQLAYAISSLRELVTKNLNVAYRNLAISAIKAKNFKTAVFYAIKTGDRQLLMNTYQNAAAHYAKQNNFRKAKYFATRSEDRAMEQNIKRNEGIYYYKANNINKALKIFQSLNDRDMEKACYQKQYNDLVKKVSSVKTLEDARKLKSTYQKMLELGNKLGDSRIQQNIRKTLSQI